MKQNKYDQSTFFQKYNAMERSVAGLKGAGEWHILEKTLPDFKNKRVLDLGCGFGWHCQYAIEHGAKNVIGIDISQKMLKKAKEITSKKIQYKQCALEDIDFPHESFDIVMSILTFHYLKSWRDIVKNIKKILIKDGIFIFSVEHPVFTAYGTEQWYANETGEILHWPVDNYFNERMINASFLDENVIKYHRTITTYFKTLLDEDFTILDIIEPTPSKELLEKSKMMQDEMRRPMMLIIKAKKN